MIPQVIVDEGLNSLIPCSPYDINQEYLILMCNQCNKADKELKLFLDIRSKGQI